MNRYGKACPSCALFNAPTRPTCTDCGHPLDGVPTEWREGLPDSPKAPEISDRALLLPHETLSVGLRRCAACGSVVVRDAVNCAHCGAVQFDPDLRFVGRGLIVAPLFALLIAINLFVWDIAEVSGTAWAVLFALAVTLMPLGYNLVKRSGAI